MLKIDETNIPIEEKELHDLELQEQNENGLIIIPWNIYTGFLVNTEKGLSYEYKEPESFSEFNLVFTGRDNVICNWDGVVPWYKPKGINRATFRAQIGKYYFGKLLSGEFSTSTEFANGEYIEEMIDFKMSKEIKVKCLFPLSNLLENNAVLSNQQKDTHYFYPQEKDHFKFYTIPTLTGKKWLYISSVDYLCPTNNSNIWECEITFSSVSDRLRKTGLAQEQFIQYAAAGDPHVEPKINITDEGKYEVYYQSIEAQPITHIQVELLGAGALCGVNVLGRKLNQVEQKDGHNLYNFDCWKHLLPFSFFSPNNSEYNKNCAATKNMFYFPNCDIRMWYSKDLFDIRKNTQNSIAKMDYSGILTIGEKSDWTHDLDADSYHKSNIPQSNGLYWDYFNVSWHPLAEITPPTYDCSNNPYCENTITLTNSMNARDIFAINSLAFMSNLELKLGFNSSKPFRASNLYLVGGMLTGPLGDWIAIANTLNMKANNFGLFMDCELAKYLAAMKLNADVDPVGVFIDDFTDTNNGNWAGTQAMNLTMCWELSDKFSKSNVIYDTKYLAQRKNEEGVEFDTPILYGSDCQVVEKDEGSGYSIDKILIQGIYKGNIRISMYSYDNMTLSTPIWQTTVMSNAAWTGSFRSWTSIISTGGIPNQLIERSDNFTWPENPRKTAIQTEGVIQTNWQNNFDKPESNVGTNWFEAGEGEPEPVNPNQGQWWTGKKYAYVKNNNSNATQYEYNYSTIDQDTQNRTDFLNKYKNIEFNSNNSFAHIHCHDVFYNDDFTTQNVGLTYSTKIELENNIFETNYDVCAILPSDVDKDWYYWNYPHNEIKNNIVVPNEYLGCYSLKKWYGGWVQHEGSQVLAVGSKIHIEFQEYKMVINISDSSYLCYGAFEENQNLRCLPIGGEINFRTNQINYTVKLNYITFKQ